MRKLIAIVLLSFSFKVQSQKLSTEEKKMVTYIRQHLPETILQLQQMVDINSGTLNTEGVKKVGAILREQFGKIGFTTDWVTLPDSLKRAGHLVATRKGKKGKKLFLIGHLDTVFEPDMPTNPYKVLNDSTATGQGVNDMKGGDIIILAALQAINSIDALTNTNITAYFTGDEERAGQPTSVSRANFIEKAKQADIALAFEGAQSLSTVATARRGSSGWLLTVTGQQAHSSGVFNNNYGAIYEASRIVNEFRRQLSIEKYLTFNPRIFVGGSEVAFEKTTSQASVSGKTNIISPATFVQGDLRFLTEAQIEAARTKMRAIATTSNLAATKATIEFDDGIPAMEPTKGNDSLLQVLSKVSMDMGLGAIKAGDPGSRGAGDISYIAKYVACLDGLGASGSGAHAPGETINLKEFPILIERAAVFIYRLTR